jgi:hypothetical protein
VTSIKQVDKHGKAIEYKHDFMDALVNVKNGLILLKNKPTYILIGLTESLLFSTLHIFIFIWSPILRELNSKVETNEVFTLFMMSLMAGGAFYRVIIYLTQAILIFFNNNIFAVVKLVSFFSLLAHVLAVINKGYDITLLGFILYEAAIGMLYPTYSKLKSEYLPAEQRGTLMNIFKIPLNLTIIFLLLTMKWLFTLRQVRIV